jgi:CBS domain containing-hemolysin-like protein
LEDILEEIVGEINDEYDEEEKNYVRINSNTFVFEGKTLLSDFYKILNLDDEIFSEVEGDADSLAGLLLEIKGDFPELNEKIDYLNFTFEILEMEERRISKVKVIVHQPSSTSDQTA